MSTLQCKPFIGYNARMTPCPEHPLTPQQVADALGVSRQTVLRLVAAGRLHPLAPPNPVLARQRLRFAPSEVARFRATLAGPPAPAQ